ncbi:MAG: ABC transporter ATP-binding protein [Acidobacteriota bacterium]
MTTGARSPAGLDAGRSASGALRPAPALCAVDLAFGWRPERPIVDGLDLELRAGELVCLLGPNGAGKSTLLRTLAGLQPALDGRIELAGRALDAWTPRERARRLAVVLTERMMPGMVTGVELVRLGRQPYTPWSGRLGADDHEAVAAALDAVGAEGLALRPLGQMSDGERQKVMIARALAQEASALVLDEPTAFLDLPRRAEILRILRRLAHDAGKAVLLSTHDLDLALRGADRLWLLAGGRLRVGLPEELVLDGSFAAAFAGEGVDFDSESGSFRLHRRRRGAVHLHGEGLAATWTRRALERDGWRLDASASVAVEVVDGEPDDATWRLRGAQGSVDVDSLGALLEHLESEAIPIAPS